MCYELVFGIDDLQVAVIQPVMADEILVEGLGPGRLHNGLASLGFGHLLMIAHAVPEFFGDEWQERMQKPQSMREDEIQHRERGRLLCFGLAVGARE